MQELTIILKDRENLLTVTRTIGDQATDMVDAFSGFMLAAGFAPDLVKRIFEDE